MRFLFCFPCKSSATEAAFGITNSKAKWLAGKKTLVGAFSKKKSRATGFLLTEGPFQVHELVYRMIWSL
jgi:hypothetical protein